MKKRKRTKYPQLRKWRRWRYKNTILLILSFIGLFFLAKTPLLDSAIQGLGNLGYLGALIVGFFFVSTFTVAPAMVMLFHLAETLHPLEVAVLAGLGAMLGDFIIFRFMKDKVFEELQPLFLKLHTPKVKILLGSPYFGWLVPLFGAFIIASPLPDEVGVGMLGLSRIRRWQFFCLAFVLNATGILITISLAQAL